MLGSGGHIALSRAVPAPLQAAHAKEMEDVERSCTSHLKHLQEVHGEELATIYAEMKQARNAAEDLFTQKEELMAKLVRLQRTAQGHPDGVPQQQLAPYDRYLPLPLMPAHCRGVEWPQHHNEEDRTISMSVAKAVQEEALSKLHDEHRQTIQELEDALAAKTTELEQLRHGLEAEKLQEVMSLQHGYEARLQASVREETERMQQVLLEVVNKVTPKREPQAPHLAVALPVPQDEHSREDPAARVEESHMKLEETNARLSESHERNKVQETMIMEMAEKASLKQTEINYLVKSCQDLVEGIAVKQREVEKLQQSVDVQSSQLKQALKENQQLTEYQQKGEGEMLLLRDQISKLQTELNRSHSVILQHQMGFDQLQHKLQREPVPADQVPLSQPPPTEDSVAVMKETMQAQYEQLMQEEVARLQALHERDMEQLKATSKQEMQSLEAANAGRLKEQMSQDLQAVIDEKVKDRVALKQQEQRRLYQQQVEAIEKEKQRDLKQMKKEFDETLWMLESQHQKDMQRLKKEQEETELARVQQRTAPCSSVEVSKKSSMEGLNGDAKKHAQRLRGLEEELESVRLQLAAETNSRLDAERELKKMKGETEPTRRSNRAKRGALSQNSPTAFDARDAPEFLRESAEARLANKAQGDLQRDKWFLGLEEWQVLAAKQMVPTTEATVNRNATRGTNLPHSEPHAAK